MMVIMIIIISPCQWQQYDSNFQYSVYVITNNNHNITLFGQKLNILEL